MTGRRTYIIVYIILASSLSTIVAACAASVELRPATTDLAVARREYPDITTEQLHKGYNLYISTCSGCHALYPPTTYRYPDWKKVLPEMFSRAKLDTSEQQLILKYLAAKSPAL